MARAQDEFESHRGDSSEPAQGQLACKAAEQANLAARMAITPGTRTAARPQRLRLGDVLVSQKAISQEQLQARARGAEAHRAQARPRAGRSGLRHRGADLAGARAPAQPRRSSTSSSSTSTARVVLKLPEAQARRFRALVLEDRGATMLVGMADPTDLFAFDELDAHPEEGRRGRGGRPRARCCCALDQRLPPHRGDQRPRARSSSRTWARRRWSISARSAPALGAEEAPVVKLLQSVFEDATQVRRLRHPHRAAGKPPADPLPHRRRAAAAGRGRPARSPRRWCCA